MFSPWALLGQLDLPELEGRFERFTPNDGLAQAAIQTIEQDEKGFLWLGTRGGLSRFDGQQFFNYRRQPRDSTSLSNNQVIDIYASGKGVVWVGTFNGLCRFSYATNKFTRYIPNPTKAFSQQNTINKIVCLPGGGLLLATNAGAGIFDPHTQTFDFNHFEELKSDRVFAAIRAEDGTLILANPSGLHLYNEYFQFIQSFPMGESTPKSSKINNPIHCIFQDSQQRIWIGSDVGLHQFHPQSGTYTLYKYDHRKAINPISDIDEKEDGTLLLCAMGLLSFRDGQFIGRNTHDPEDLGSIPGNNLISVKVGMEGNVWLGTNGFGFCQQNSNSFPFHTLRFSKGNKNSLSNPYVSSIFQQHEGLLYIGNNTGLDVFEQTSLEKIRTIMFLSPISGSPIGVKNLVYNHDSSSFWVTTENSLWKLSLNRNSVPKLVYDSPMGAIQCLVPLGDSAIVLGLDKGIYTWSIKSKTLTKFPSAIWQHNESILHQIHCLKLYDQTLWIGTLQGLYQYHFASKEERAYLPNPKKENSLPEGRIISINQDSDGNLWVGTWGGGLAKLNHKTGTFESYDVSDGLPNNVVYSVLESKKGEYWLSTNEGISKFTYADKKFTNFTYIDGLQGQEFNSNAYFKAADGQLYFGGVNGLTYFQPEDIQVVNKLPTTLITEFLLNHKEIELGPESPISQHIMESDRITLDWDENNFGFQLSAIDFQNPNPRQYRYKLMGFSSEWEEIGTVNFLNFPSLEPGAYTLHVQAANKWGEWDTEGTTLEILIQSPLWHQVWFRVSTVLVVIVLIILVSIWRSRQLRFRNERLEKLILQRTQTILEQKEEISKINRAVEKQNTELKSTSSSLEKRNTELQTKQHDLESLRKTLESQVQERTIELIQVNKELAEQNSQLEQFAFITAHNLKAPISQFHGLLNILPPDHTFDGYTREVIDRMRSSAIDLKEVVSDLSLILDIKKGTERAFIGIDLIPTLKKVANSLEQEALKKGVRILLPDDQEAVVLGNPPYVHSIIHNLLHNAIKYSDVKRKSYVETRLIITDEIIELIVEDNGVGFDMDMAKDKVFKLYQRFNTAHPGKGFGLFLVKTQIEAMGGSVSISSEVDKGTSIFVHFIRMPQMDV